MTAAPTFIEDYINVEKLDRLLFRSINLWKPTTGRGVFGGQTIAQSLLSASQTVDPAYTLHSMHCYFISFGDADQRIIYRVHVIREGRSYATRAVKAEQDGRQIFYLVCSFQKPEPTTDPSLTFQTEMPLDVLPPEECEPLESKYSNALSDTSISQTARIFFERLLRERAASSTEILFAKPKGEAADPQSKALWFRCKSARKEHDPILSKCILAFISDFELVGTAAKPLQIQSRSDLRLAMVASLDHNMHFYKDVDPSEWFLYQMVADVTEGGRGTASGRIYTRDGALAAITRQEGVIRVEQSTSKL